MMTQCTHSSVSPPGLGMFAPPGEGLCFSLLHIPPIYTAPRVNETRSNMWKKCNERAGSEEERVRDKWIIWQEKKDGGQRWLPVTLQAWEISGCGSLVEKKNCYLVTLCSFGFTSSVCLLRRLWVWKKKKQRGGSSIFHTDGSLCTHWGALHHIFYQYCPFCTGYWWCLQSYPNSPSPFSWRLSTWALFFKHFSFSDRRYFYFYFPLPYWGIMKVVHLWVRSIAID